MTENINFSDGNQFGYVRFYSLANPALPELVGREKLAEAYSGIPGRLALFGDYAYIATINAGLQVVSISQAKANQLDNKPSDGSSIAGVFDSIGQGLGQPSDILVLNGVNALLTTTSGSLAILDITEPYFPMLVTSIGQNDGRRFTRIAAAMQYQYMDVNNIPRNMDLVLAASQEGKIRTIDMSNPASPQVLATTLDETETSEVSIVARDLVINKESSLAFVTSLNTIYVIDVKDPYRPKVINRYSALYDPSGARDATGALITIPVGQIPAIVEKGGWIYAANQQTGVKILNFDPPLIKPDVSRYFVLLGKDKKATRDYLLTYRIQTDPGADGDFENLRVVLYKNNAHIQLFTDVLPDDPMMLIEAGTPFDIDSSYHARVIVYDKQTRNDIMSPVIPIVIGRFSLLDLDENNDLVGAVTDGTSKLVLSLKVSPNYQGITPVFSLFDPQLGGDISATGKLLIEDGREVISALVPIDPDTRTAKVKFRPPAKFVRSASDATLSERSVAVDLGIADKIPEIRLKRPPVNLVHGVWANRDSWKKFEELMNPDSTNKQFDIVKTDYRKNNAGSFSSNVDQISEEIQAHINDTIKSGFAASKVNYVGHSMGGLLLKEYCINNSTCANIINKYVSIDSPHKGSELANLVINVNETREAKCFSVLNDISTYGHKTIWEDNAIKTALAGGLRDLAVGSQSIQGQQSFNASFPWQAVIGEAEDGSFGHSSEYILLWMLLNSQCYLSPDSSFSAWFGYVKPLFNEKNDRIVSESSQKGKSLNVTTIDKVDHSTVLNDEKTVNSVIKFIEE